MEHIAAVPGITITTPDRVVGQWFLRGFADAYGAHWAVTPEGLAGEHYRRGYELGVAAVRAEYMAVMAIFERPSAPVEVSY